MSQGGLRRTVRASWPSPDEGSRFRCSFLMPSPPVVVKGPGPPPEGHRWCKTIPYGFPAITALYLSRNMPTQLARTGVINRVQTQEKKDGAEAHGIRNEKSGQRSPPFTFFRLNLRVSSIGIVVVQIWFHGGRCRYRTGSHRIGAFHCLCPIHGFGRWGFRH